jgi:hypothetical protein
MKLASETRAGLRIPIKPALEALLTRLEALSMEPGFSAQRQLALSRALRPYFERGAASPLAPLTQEVGLANLYLYADFYPEDGQLTLIEQLRDVITEHVPEEERAWLNTLKHSYMDLLELLSVDGDGIARTLHLRSLGDRSTFRVQGGDFSRGLVAGQMLLTRLIREPSEPDSSGAVPAGSAIVLSAEDGQELYESALEWQREMEAASGSFALGEWQEFAKRYPYVLLWGFAQMRFDALLDAVVNIRYRTPSGKPYLYALALYEHHEFTYLAEGLSEFERLEPEARWQPNGAKPAAAETQAVRLWVQREKDAIGQVSVAARLTLTPTQLMVECDSREHLDAIKHRLASAFGFSLHFRGESTTPPTRELLEADLAKDEPLSLTITIEEDRALLASFFGTIYLEWAEQNSPALDSQTPRHAVTTAAGRANVAALIDEIERNDLGLRRTGKPAFDYSKLRTHVGLM